MTRQISKIFANIKITLYIHFLHIIRVVGCFCKTLHFTTNDSMIVNCGHKNAFSCLPYFYRSLWIIIIVGIPRNGYHHPETSLFFIAYVVLSTLLLTTQSRIIGAVRGTYSHLWETTLPVSSQYAPRKYDKRFGTPAII